MINKCSHVVRIFSLIVVVVLISTITPITAQAGIGNNGAILLNDLKITIRGVTFTPSVNITNNEVIYTIDGTEGKVSGLDTDIGHVMYLSFKTKRNGDSTNALIPITYAPWISKTDTGTAEADNGDWTGGPEGYGYKIKNSNNFSYTCDLKSDANYYLYKFRLYKGALNVYDKNDFTDYVIKVKKLSKKDTGVYFNYLFAGYNYYPSFKRLYGPDFNPKATGKNYREYFIDKNVLLPKQIRISCINHYQTTMKINGKYENGKIDRIYTLTAKKPYVEITLVPHASADSETEHYVTTTWRIGVKPSTTAVNNAIISSVSDKPYNGKQLKPSVKVELNGKTLKKGTHYTLSYGKNKNIGQGTITVNGKGSYKGSQKVFFKIVPKKTSITKMISGKKLTKISWKKNSAAQKVTKYQIRYRVKGTGKWTTKTVSAKSGSYTAKKLKKGKVYQFQVRSYKTVSKVKYYSAWSKIKTSKKIK